jgi:hypothetical protein
MAQRVSSGFCHHCNAQVMTTQNAPSHVIHAIISLFLLGLWIPIWFLRTLCADPPRCTRCGQHVSTGAVNGAVAILMVVVATIGIGIALSIFSGNDRPSPQIAKQAAATADEPRDSPPVAVTPEEAESSRRFLGGLFAADASATPPASFAPPAVKPLATRPVAPAAGAAVAIAPSATIPLKPALPWQAERQWLIDGKLVTGSVKSWNTANVVIETRDGRTIETTPDRITFSDRYWVESKMK